MRTAGLITLLRRLLIVGLYALLLVPFVVSYSTTFPFVVGKALAFRAMVEILAALWVALLLFDPRSRPKKSWVLWALAANAAVLLITTFTGVDPHRSFWGDFERMGGVFNALHALLLPFIAVSVLHTERAWHRFWGWGLLTATVMAGIALTQRFSGTDIFGVHGGRVDGTLGNSIYLGQYALFFFFVGLLVAVQAKNRMMRALAALAATLQIPVLLLTESRGALLGLFVGIAVLLFWWLIRPELSAYRFRRAAIAVAAFGLVVAVGIFFFGNRVPLLGAIPGLRSFTLEQLRSGGGTATRYMNWSIALEAWRARPIAGWGPENYRYALDLFFRPEFLKHSSYETWFDHAHNGFLDVLAMEGTLGALAALLLYGAVVAALARVGRGSRYAALRSGFGLALLASYLGQLVFVFDNATSLLVLALFYGWVARVEFGDAPTRAAPLREGAPLTKGLVVSVAAIACFLLVTRWLIPAARANVALAETAKAIGSGDLAGGLAARERAQRVRTPYGRDVRKAIGYFAAETFIRAARPSDDGRALWNVGVADLEENIRRFPLETDDRYHLAQLLLHGAPFDSAALKAAEQAARDAIAYSPKRQQLRFVLAKILLLEKRPAEAVAVLRETVALDPEVSDSHWFLGFALRDAGDLSGAYAETQKAIELGYEPANSAGWGAMSLLAERHGDAAAAFWYAGLALRADGKLPEAYRLFGNAIAKGYRWKDSTDVFLLSYLARDVGEYGIAYQLIKNELGPWMPKLDPVEYDARLAEAAYRAGDYFTAYDAAQRAVRALPRLNSRLAPMLTPGAAAGTAR